MLAKIDPMKAKGTDEELKHVLTSASLLGYLAGQRKDLPHIEYYLGTSNAINPLKTKVRELLKRLGSRSQSDCPVCKANVRRNPN